MSSSYGSNDRQILSIFCLRAFRNVSLESISKKNPMLASFWELCFSILRKARFSWRVSRMPLVELYLDSYFIWDKLNADSSVNDMYILFVTLYSI